MTYAVGVLGRQAAPEDLSFRRVGRLCRPTRAKKKESWRACSPPNLSPPHTARSLLTELEENHARIRRTQADRRRRPECRLRGGRPPQWSGGSVAARLALRHLQLCRRRTVAGAG